MSPMSIGDSESSKLPIFTLHSDILWRIFSLNADMELKSEEEEVHALHTLRHTSQVCSDWRNLAIGSPSLWGQVLNVAALAQKGDEWRGEVIRRTGTSWLHIKATGDSLSGMESFVQSVLNQHWARVRSLDLDVPVACSPISDEKWCMFQRPAAFLETFKIFCPDAKPGSLSNPDIPLFANIAPSLRTLSVINVGLDVKVPWIHNLRHLALSSPIIPAVELLRSLFLMPFQFLESVELSDLIGTPVLGNSKRSLRHVGDVTLPRLKQITLYPNQEISAILSLLAHIIPVEGCTLELFATAVSAEDCAIDSIPNVLPKYLQYCTELTAATSALVSLTRDTIIFLTPLPSGETFRFGFECKAGFPENMTSTFLSCFATYPFDKIRNLRLHISLDESELSNTAITRFILALVSVEYLEANSSAIHLLDMVQKQTGVVAFPFLKNIEICETGGALLIEDFLDSRSVVRGSVDTLTLLLWPGAIGHLTSLEKKFPGLTIHFLNYDGAVEEIVVL